MGSFGSRAYSFGHVSNSEGCFGIRGPRSEPDCMTRPVSEHDQPHIRSPHWRLHDFRRTIVSILARKPFRYNPVMLDLLLGHQPSQLSPVARIYQQEKHHDDRREGLEAWAKHLTKPPASVSDLHQERARSALR